jgi:pheromone shutdown protein TraB
VQKCCAEAARPRLTLIGTVHRDPRGAERLQSLLRSLHPDLITLEMSEKALAYRLGDARRQLLRIDRLLVRLARELPIEPVKLQAHPAVADIRTLLALPFEYQAAAAYAAGGEVPLHLIDRSDISAAKLQRVERELITYRNLKILVSLPVGAEKSDFEGYGRAHAMITRDPGETVRQAFLAGRRGEEGIGGRDRWMAAQIRRLLAARRGGHLVHVGGWVHLIEDARGETLYSLLADLEPQRLLLG